MIQTVIKNILSKVGNYPTYGIHRYITRGRKYQKCHYERQVIIPIGIWNSPIYIKRQEILTKIDLPFIQQYIQRGSKYQQFTLRREEIILIGLFGTNPYIKGGRKSIRSNFLIRYQKNEKITSKMNFKPMYIHISFDKKKIAGFQKIIQDGL